MLNATCQPPEAPVVDTISRLTLFVSVPTYSVTFWVLLFKSPPSFVKYRNLLVIHILSCLLLELHMSLVWKAVVILPWTVACSTGLGEDNVTICLQVFVLFFIFIGISVVKLFNYRMKVVAEDRYPKGVKRYIRLAQPFFYSLCGITAISMILAYDDLKNQNDFKLGVQKKFGGSVPELIWCDNCFFLPLKSIYILSFFATGIFAIGVVFIQCFIASFVAVKTLMSMKARLSAKTISLQINFLVSLFMMVTVHVLFVALPIASLMIVMFITVSASYMPISYTLAIMLREHGTASTLTMLLTNKLLLQIVKDTVSKYIPWLKGRLNPIEGRVVSVTLPTGEQRIS